MGLSPAEFKDGATKSFTPLKHKYHERQYEPYVIHIDGKRSARRRTIGIDIECDRAACNHTKCDQMEKFFEPVLQENFDMIRKCLEEDNQIEAIIAMGGFANSQHFMSGLKAEFGQVQRLRGTRAKDHGDSTDSGKIHNQDGNKTMVGFNHPVARGALLRHYEVAHRDLPTQHCFMVAEDAPWDPIKHGPKKHHTVIKGEANPHEDWVKGLSRTESNDFQDDAKDADFAPSKASRKRAPFEYPSSEPSQRRKTDQLKRAASQKHRSCQNCGYDTDDTSLLSWAENVCASCAFSGFLCRHGPGHRAVSGLEGTAYS
ncbi:hypothetical protein BST61_g3777 [Cercospora zeina]